MPNVPASPCSNRYPGCPNLRPCPDHPEPKPWEHGKTARAKHNLTLPPHQEARRRRRILKRDAYICHVCHEPFADQVDHVTPLAEGGTDTDDNLAAIHEIPCHRTKTAAEAARGRARSHARRRPQ